MLQFQDISICQGFQVFWMYFFHLTDIMVMFQANHKNNIMEILQPQLKYCGNDVGTLTQMYLWYIFLTNREHRLTNNVVK